MKFDYIIGNPPYQEESQTSSKTNKQNPRTNIFHYFQMASDHMAKSGSVLIYPGGRWIQQSGKGLKGFGFEQINDKHLKKIVFYSDSKELFGQAADLSDGISIVVKNYGKQTEGFEYEYHKDGRVQIIQANPPGEDVMPLNPDDIPIVEKIKKGIEKYNLSVMHNAILPRSLFGIESDFVFNNPDKVRPYEDESSVNYDSEIKLFTNDKPGKAGRATWFVCDKNVIKHNQSLINEWQVVVSSANAGGQKRDNQLEIIDNHSAFGRARVALRSFPTQQEAVDFSNYVKTYLVKYAFLMSDEALSTLGLYVPDFIDYTRTKSLLNYSKDLDEQLFELFDLSDEDIEYIKQVVDNLR